MLFRDTGGKSKWAVVGEVCSQKWERYGPSVCPWAKHSASSVTSKAGSSLSWLPSEEKMQRCSLTLEGHWSQEQLISAGERLRSPPHLAFSPRVSHPALLKTDRDEESSLFLAQKSGSLSRRDGAKLQKAHVIEQP